MGKKSLENLKKTPYFVRWVDVIFEMQSNDLSTFFSTADGSANGASSYWRSSGSIRCGFSVISRAIYATHSKVFA